MPSNPAIPASIQHWHIAFDPYGFASQETWLEDAEKTEDILQLQHVDDAGLMIDVGWYAGIYRAVVIANTAWDEPVEAKTSSSPAAIKTAVYSWITQYAFSAGPNKSL